MMKKIKFPIFYSIVIFIFIASVLGLLKYRDLNIKTVSVSDKGQNYFLKTYAKTVEDVLENCKIVLKKNDKVSEKLDLKIKNGLEIKIRRSYDISISYGDKVITVSTTKHIVREILKENNIEIKSDDIVVPFIDAKISEGTHINITKVKIETVIEKSVIPYNTEVNLVENLDDFEVVKISDGVKGLKEIEYKLRYENGKMVSKSLISEKIISQPISEVKNKGIATLFVTSRGMPFKYSEILIVSSTAYDLSFASCGKYPSNPAYGMTYSGTKARPGIIAVDPRVIPLGSTLYIQSLDGSNDYGFALAQDVGGAIKGKKIDLFIGDSRAAMRYGRKKVRIYVIMDEINPSEIKGFGY